VYCYIEAPEWEDELAVRSAFNLEILKLAAELGVSFAHPTRTLRIERQVTPRDVEPRLSLDEAQLAAIVKRYGPPPAADTST
jgi:MscS family membrane protein